MAKRTYSEKIIILDLGKFSSQSNSTVEKQYCERLNEELLESQILNTYYSLDINHLKKYNNREKFRAAFQETKLFIIWKILMTKEWNL